MPDLTARITQILTVHVDRQLTNYDTGREECDCGKQGSVSYDEHLAAVLAQAAEQHYRPRIETVEALKAIKRRPDLINGALIRVVGYPYFGAVLELNDDGTWNDLDATSAVGQRIAPDDIPLPVSLLWSPGAGE